MGLTEDDQQAWDVWLSEAPVKISSDFYGVRCVARLGNAKQMLELQAVVGRGVGIQGWKEEYLQA